MNRLFSLLISFLMLFSFSTAYAQPIIVGEDSAPTYPENLVDGGDPAVAIEEARNANPEEFAWKVDQLRQSKALMALFKGAPDEETVKFYLEFFAIQSSVEQIKTFVANTEGKHFEISGTAEAPVIQLKEGAPDARNITTKDCCACWEAWMAALAYFGGSHMTCKGVGAASSFALTPFGGALAGVICDGVFFAIGLLPDFNNACH